MIDKINFSGVFTLDEHIRILGELTSMNNTKNKDYNCNIYKDVNGFIHIDLKQQKRGNYTCPNITV